MLYVCLAENSVTMPFVSGVDVTKLVRFCLTYALYCVNYKNEKDQNYGTHVPGDKQTNMNIGTASKATLGKLLRDGVKRIWAFPSAEIPSLIELNLTEENECWVGGGDVMG